MYRDTDKKLRLQRGDIGTFIYSFLGYLFLALFVVFVAIGIWTGSEQWSYTGLLMVVPTIVFGVIASLRI